MPGAMTQSSYNLKNVEVTLNNGVVADITNISIARKLQKTERTPGGSKTARRTINKHDSPEISFEGWNSDDLAFADLPPGMKITAFAVDPTAAADNATFLQSDFMTLWPISGWYLGDTDTSLGESDNSKWKSEVLCDIDGSYLDEDGA